MILTKAQLDALDNRQMKDKLENLASTLHEVRTQYQHQVQAEIDLVHHNLTKRCDMMSAELNQLRQMRSDIAAQLYKFGLVLLPNDQVVKLNIPAK